MELSIVVPCYNEQEVLPRTLARLLDLLRQLVDRQVVDPDSRVVFVDDGSRDATWTLIEQYSESHPAVHGLKLSRNYGHQNALLAGLLTVRGDAVITLDADLQDDPGAIEAMLEHHRRGADVVYGVRQSRASDSWFKRSSARLFYRLIRRGDSRMIADHADFRLMSRRAIEELRGFGEVNLYLRGIIPLIGLPSSTVTYDRQPRQGGKTKYPLRKMLAFAFDGLSSFSTLPLKVITGIGLTTFLGCMGITAWALFVRMFTDRAIPGWASTVLPIYTIGAIQILCMGLVGEYLAKIYTEVKSRPRFIVERTTAGLPPRLIRSESEP